MVWFRIDDKFHDHPKPQRAGVSAIGLWTLAGSWASDNVSTYDGFIPARILPRFEKNWRPLAKRLVEAGLWEAGQYDGEDGWWFHDWKDQNPTRAEVLEKRAEAKDRMARVRANKRERSREQGEDRSREVRDTFALPRPDPSRPVPSPTAVVGDLGGDRPETLRAVPATNPPKKQPNCSRHPNGNPTNEACHGCKRVNEREERKATAEDDRIARENERAALACTRCDGVWVVDENSRATGRKCDHRKSA